MLALTSFLALSLPAAVFGKAPSTVDEVFDWASAEVNADVAAKLRERETDGRVLLWIDEGDVKDDLGLSGVEAKKLLAAIHSLKQAYPDKDGDGTHDPPTMDFHQYRAFNRNAMDHMALGMTGIAPRTALWLLNEFPDHGKPTEEDGWLTWVFVPHWYILQQASNICGGLPFMLKLSVGLTLVAQFLNICITFLFGGAKGVALQLVGVVTTMFGAEAIGFCIMMFHRYIIYPILPWFFCDFIFWVEIYLAPLGQMVWISVRLILAILALMAADPKRR